MKRLRIDRDLMTGVSCRYRISITACAVRSPKWVFHGYFSGKVFEKKIFCQDWNFINFKEIAVVRAVIDIKELFPVLGGSFFIPCSEVNKNI